MKGNGIVKAVLLLLLMAEVPRHSVCAQSNPNSKSVPSLQAFFQGLVDRYNPSSLPKYEDVLKVIDQIQTARADDIVRGLPAVFTALAHPDVSVKVDAAFALWAISRRGDGTGLLAKRIPDIAGVLNESDGRLQGFALAVFENFRPPPVREILPALLAFLNRTDRDSRQQAAAVWYLARNVPDNAEEVVAILDFLSRPLDREARIDALNALGTPQVKNPNIIDRVIASLDDPDPAIRFTAADVLPRMGPHTLLLAKPTLERLAADPDQPADVKDEVKKALEQIHGDGN